MNVKPIIEAGLVAMLLLSAGPAAAQAGQPLEAGAPREVAPQDATLGDPPAADASSVLPQTAGAPEDGEVSPDASTGLVQSEGDPSVLPPADAGAGVEAVAADPAVWGPYARLVGKTFAGEGIIDGRIYDRGTRIIQWEVPGEVMLETGVQGSGTELPKTRILPGKRPGELLFDVARAPNATGRIVDSDTLQFDLMLGYQNIVRTTGPGTYEMQTLKRGEVQNHTTYRDIDSEAYAQRIAERDEEKAADKHSAMLALRAAGVPDEAAGEAPADRVLAYQEPVRGPAGTLRITRGKAWEAGACYAAVYINGRWAARLDDAETASFKVPAGQVQVSVSTDPQGRGTCRVGQSTQTVHETVLAKGEALHVHFVFSGGVRFREALLPTSTAAL